MSRPPRYESIRRGAALGRTIVALGSQTARQAAGEFPNVRRGPCFVCVALSERGTQYTSLQTLAARAALTGTVSASAKPIWSKMTLDGQQGELSRDESFAVRPRNELDGSAANTAHGTVRRGRTLTTREPRFTASDRQGDARQPVRDERSRGSRAARDRRPKDSRFGEREVLLAYARPHFGRSLTQLATSVIPYFVLSVVIYRMLSISLALVLLLAIPAAGFQVRTFIVFHDCSHGSFLPSKRANAWLGAVLGLLVLAPFRRWRHDHAVHHATSGDLERRGVGDIPTLTLSEYASRSWRGRLGYRVFRHPLVMFGLGPIFAMIIGPRIATRSQRPRLRHSVLGTDLALALVVGGLCWLIGWKDFLLTWGPASLLAGSIGIWLFYVQHQFEDAYWKQSSQWSYIDAALQGSSYLKLPKLLQFFSGNIGLHHVHHLNAKIPNYNLQRAHDENPMFQQVPVLTLRGGLHAVQLKLWDESDGTLITFREAHKRMHPQHATTS